MIRDLTPVCFVPSTDLARSRSFFSEVLGLPLVGDDGFALVFDLAGSVLRVVAAGPFEPQPFTILGWETTDIAMAVDQLGATGIEFIRYPQFEQDDRGIWTAPNGTEVAWFRDPDGNVLSLSSLTTQP